MAKTLSITIPDVVHAALKQEGGALLNLKPAAMKPDPAQTELVLA